MNTDSATLKSAPRRPISRTDRRRQEAVERVLETATHLFSERGFAETSMAAIADAADVSVGTLYNLFENKDALYVELMRGKAELFRNRLVPVLSAGAPLDEVIDRYAIELLGLFREEAVAIRLYWRVSAQARISFRATLAEPIRSMYDDTVVTFARILTQGHGRNGEPTAQAYRAALCCQASLGELFLLHIDDPKSHPAKTVVAEAKTIMRAVTAPFTQAQPRGRKHESV